MKVSIGVAVVLAFLLCSNASAREKSDIVWMSNGDRLTGEIKYLQHGKLLLSTHSLGNVNIEWDEIERVKSDYDFQFERMDAAVSPESSIRCPISTRFPE